MPAFCAANVAPHLPVKFSTMDPEWGHTPPRTGRTAGQEKHMSSHHESSSGNHSLAARLEKEGEVSVADCYQCGKCTAGCPAAEEMDVAPSQILRLLQTESGKHEERALKSMAI